MFLLVKKCNIHDRIDIKIKLTSKILYFNIILAKYDVILINTVLDIQFNCQFYYIISVSQVVFPCVCSCLPNYRLVSTDTSFYEHGICKALHQLRSLNKVRNALLHWTHRIHRRSRILHLQHRWTVWNRSFFTSLVSMETPSQHIRKYHCCSTLSINVVHVR